MLDPTHRVFRTDFVEKITKKILFEFYVKFQYYLMVFSLFAILQQLPVFYLQSNPLENPRAPKNQLYARLKNKNFSAIYKTIRSLDVIAKI